MDSKIIKTALKKQQLEVERHLDLYSEFVINNRISRINEKIYTLTDSNNKVVYKGSKKLCLVKQGIMFSLKNS